jgi:hypothetical protein
MSCPIFLGYNMVRRLEVLTVLPQALTRQRCGVVGHAETMFLSAILPDGNISVLSTQFPAWYYLCSTTLSSRTFSVHQWDPEAYSIQLHSLCGQAFPCNANNLIPLFTVSGFMLNMIMWQHKNLKAAQIVRFS